MDKDYYRLYFDIERNHWWFKARSRILRNYIASNIATSKPLNILNIGAATGATSVMLSEFGKVSSLEYDQETIDLTKGKVPIDIIHGSILALPYPDHSFDLACAFDVIEHVEDHQLAASEIIRVVKPGGSVFVTVPAKMSLWSEHDEVNHHFRRYTINGLNSLFEKEGGKGVFSSYFNFFLFPFIYLARKAAELFRNKKQKLRSDFEKFKPGIFGSVLFYLFRSESVFLRRKMYLPWGVSAMLHWKKNE